MNGTTTTSNANGFGIAGPSASGSGSGGSGQLGSSIAPGRDMWSEILKSASRQEGHGRKSVLLLCELSCGVIQFSSSEHSSRSDV